MLRSAGAAADWPRTPDLAAAVVPRLEGVTPRHPGDTPAVAVRLLPRRRTLALAFAPLLVFAASALAVPAVRHWLGFGAVCVESVPPLLPRRGGAAAPWGPTTPPAPPRRAPVVALLAPGLG